ncbi:DNA primase family protein [Larkinella sp.]|uniref:DNA primase family protein n=1 Tax=Larkinella sp. TaxID=2034517 RepID=UPI003BAC7A30
MKAPGEMQSIPTLFEDQSKDTNSASFSQERLEGLERHIVDMSATTTETFDPTPHEKVLDQLLSQIEPIDYRAYANAEGQDDKLKTKHFLVVTAWVIQDLARRNRWAICRNQDFIYIYNGAYWKVIQKDDLKLFLSRAAEKMGVDKITAQYVKFIDQLFDQFNSSAYFPAPEGDRSAVKINLLNGTFEIGIDRQQLQAPNSLDFLKYQLPFPYDPDAKAPIFHRYLNTALPDSDCRKVLAEFLGYVFISTSKLKLEKALLLYGSGANGKSVIFEITSAMYGRDNISHYGLQSLTTEPAYCRAHLANKLLNHASEISGKMEANMFKQLVSGEPVEARLPYGQPFVMTDYAKLIFNCNELPSDVEHTPAYFRRFIILPFNVTIAEKDQDKQLADKIIRTELSGVFNWVLEGLRRLLSQGRFTDCEAVRQQIELYKQQSDSVRLFLDEEGFKATPDQHPKPLKDLYSSYRSYCSFDGYRPVNNKNFKNRLNSYGIITEKKTIGQVAYVTKA